MAEIKFKIPEDFREFFKVDPLLLQIAFQRFIEEKLEEFKELERIVEKSELTEEEALELGKGKVFIYIFRMVNYERSCFEVGGS